MWILRCYCHDIFQDILRKHTKIINYPSHYTCRNSNRATTKDFRHFKIGPEVMRAVKYAEELVILTKEETVIQA